MFFYPPNHTAVTEAALRISLVTLKSLGGKAEV